MPSPPVIRHQPPSAPHTPTQRAHPYAHEAPRSAPAPRDSSSANPNANANPFSDPAPTSLPNPYDRAAAGHASEASDATFYTAAGGHSRGATFETAYEHEYGDDVGSEEAHTQGQGLRTAPPSYTSHSHAQ